MKPLKRLTPNIVERIMTQGRAVKSASFLFKFIQNEQEKPVNKDIFAFLTSKKNFPKAVDRNRARRRGRAALSRALKQFKAINKGIYGVFLLNKTVDSISFYDFVAEIQQVLIKNGILVKL